MRWRLAHRFDSQAVALADRHYSRQSVGSPQFMPPGACVVLTAMCGRAVWGVSHQRAEYVGHAWPGAWVCTIFRNEGAGLSSALIVEALSATRWLWSPPNAGVVTFVDAFATRCRRSRLSPPGVCFRHAGFIEVGTTGGGLVALHLDRHALPSAVPPVGAQYVLATE